MKKSKKLNIKTLEGVAIGYSFFLIIVTACGDCRF